MKSLVDGLRMLTNDEIISFIVDRLCTLSGTALNALYLLIQQFDSNA